MFLDYFKEFSVKKIIKNSLLNAKKGYHLGDIKTVGLLVDERFFSETQSLIAELTANGIAKENINLLLFKNKSQHDFGVKTTKLELGHLNWKAQIVNESVNEFLAKDFDLLISYYDERKSILLVVTSESEAKFKVGFSNVDKRLNNFMINTNLGNYKGFVEELFRYLKILNKI